MNMKDNWLTWGMTGAVNSNIRLVPCVPAVPALLQNTRFLLPVKEFYLDGELRIARPNQIVFRLGHGPSGILIGRVFVFKLTLSGETGGWTQIRFSKFDEIRNIEPTIQIVGPHHLITIRFDPHSTLWSSTNFDGLIVNLSHLKPQFVGTNELWRYAQLLSGSSTNALTSISAEKLEMIGKGGLSWRVAERLDLEASALVYPEHEKGPVIITWRDLCRLLPGKFLNDVLIEFRLRWWYNCLREDNSALAKQVFLFNSFFYKKLCEGQGYPEVKRWTSKVDIFQKKYLIVPIHELSHWFLAIVLHPGNLLPSKMQDATINADIQVGIGNPSTPPSTHIIIMDSMEIKHPETIQRLSDYLKLEASERKGVKDAKIAVPVQPNGFDCGLYLLHFVKVFVNFSDSHLQDILSPNVAFLPHEQMMKTWHAQDIQHIRMDMMMTICDLSDQWVSKRTDKVLEDSTPTDSESDIEIF